MGFRRELLEEAADLVEGDRNAQYGDPNQDFKRTAIMWSTYICGVMDRKDNQDEDWDETSLLDPWDIAWLMILLKSSRSTVSPSKRDHYADAAGYAACGFDTTQAESEFFIELMTPEEQDAREERINDAVDLIFNDRYAAEAILAQLQRGLEEFELSEEEEADEYEALAREQELLDEANVDG